jgi:glycosyltransferase involved in cell wall biosynthesis
MSPAISLIICVYNRRRFVADAIKSVLVQTRGDFELIVWDDGSTDDSLEVAQAAAKGDPRLRVMHAAKMLSAPYFGWIDSDDILHENALRETADILDARPEVGVVYTDYLNIDQSATVRGQGVRCKIPYSKDRLLVDFMTFHFRLIRRPLFDAVGQVDPTMQTAEDYDLCLKLSEVTEFHHLQKPLYYYRVHPESLSHKRRLEQIDTSARAIRSALARRGMDQTHQLDVRYSATFSLRKKDL